MREHYIKRGDPASYVWEAEDASLGQLNPAETLAPVLLLIFCSGARRLIQHTKALCCLEFEIVGINRKLQNSACF